jgi:hypothetical protein
LIDFDEPVKDYVGYFKELHERNVSEYFEDLVRESKVDEPANIETISQLRVFEAAIEKSSSTRGWWRFARIASIVVAAISVGVGIWLGEWYYLLFIPAVAALLFIFLKVNGEVKELNTKLADLEAKRDKKSKEAWEQMAPLNELHTWEAARTLFQKTYPDIQLDSYFSNGRLNDLYENYGLSTGFNDGRSVLVSQSGSYKENPFVIARYIQHWIGSKTYYGSIIIYWTEQVRNANGDWVTVQRSQTLTASVTKPFPEYQVRSSIIFGHEAAPNLSFSRGPSSLSGTEEGFFNNWQKDRAIKKVEKKAKKALKSGTSKLTVMSNREFEALFNASNRDNEIEFRLLYTPLAQQEVVNLLNDEEIGYGDDFTFVKSQQVNFVEPAHLGETRFDGDPRMFASLELGAARKFFNEFHQEYFRSLYFGFAPLLAVPLYRENRTIAKPSASAGSKASSFWEHEAMANFIGSNNFAHPESVTQNLLKTVATGGTPESTNVTVVAHGYRGEPRLDIVPMLGMDGKWHNVPVNWTEYLPVSQQSEIVVGVMPEPDAEGKVAPATGWQKTLDAEGISPESVLLRGGLAAIFLR